MNWLKQLELTSPYAHKLFASLTPEEEAAAAASAEIARKEAELKKEKDSKSKDADAAAKLAEADRKKQEAKDLELETLRKENAENKKRLDEIERTRLEKEGDYKKIAEKESTRADEATKRAEESEKRSNERIMVAELKARLVLEGVEDPDYYVLADQSKLSIVDGEVKGLDDLVTELRERKPALFKKPAGKDRTPSPKPRSGQDIKPDVDVRKMAPEEYKAYANKVRRDPRHLKIA